MKKRHLFCQSRNKQSGFMAAAVMGLVVMVGVAMALATSSVKRSSDIANKVAAKAETTQAKNVLTSSIASASRMNRDGETNNIIYPPMAELPAIEDGGSLPQNLGSRYDVNGNAYKYCVYYNGLKETDVVVDGSHVAPRFPNPNPTNRRYTFNDVKMAPAYAIIGAGNDGIFSRDSVCDRLVDESADENGVKNMKGIDQIREMLSNSTSKDDILLLAKTVADVVNTQGEGAANLVGGVQPCDPITQKLIYRDNDGQIEFACVEERDPQIVANNVGAGAKVFKYESDDVLSNPDDQGDQPKNLQFRSLVPNSDRVRIIQSADNIGFDTKPIIAGSGITLNEDTNGITISADGSVSGSVANIGPTGNGTAGVYRDGSRAPFQMKRIVQGTNVTVTELADSIRISATSGSGRGFVTGGVNLPSEQNGRVFKQVAGEDMQFRTIKSHDGFLSVQTVGDEVIIRNTSPGIIKGGTNVGGGLTAGVPDAPADTDKTKSIYIGQKDGVMYFRRLQSGAGIKLSEGDGCSNASGGGSSSGASSSNSASAAATNMAARGGSAKVPASGASMTTAGTAVDSGDAGGSSGVSALTGCEKSILLSLDLTGVNLNEQDPVFVNWKNNAVPTRACDIGQVLTWNGTRFTCVAGNNVGTPTPCRDSEKLAWLGSSWSCIPETDPVLASKLPATACGADEVLRWNGTTFQCTSIASMETDPVFNAAKPAAVCNGVNNKLTWDGTRFTCETDQAGAGGGGGGGTGITFLNTPVDVLPMTNSVISSWTAFNASAHIAGARTVLLEVTNKKHNQSGNARILAREFGTSKTVTLGDTFQSASGQTMVTYQMAVPVDASGRFEYQIPVNDNPAGWGFSLRLIGYYNGGGGGGGNILTCTIRGNPYSFRPGDAGFDYPGDGADYFFPFQASDCGGTLPDSSYKGVVSGIGIGYGMVNISAVNSGEVTAYGTGPGVIFSAFNQNRFRDNLYIRVVYIQNGGGGGGGGGGITVAHSGSGTTLASETGSTSNLTLKRLSGASGISVSENAGGIVLSMASGAGGWTVSGNDLFNNNSGNVGVGTNSPSSKLHVAGSMRVTGPIVNDAPTASSINMLIANQLSVTGTAGNTILNNGAGNVGIGTANPIAKLQVAGNILSTGEVSTRGTYFVARDTAGNDLNKTDMNNLAMRVINNGTVIASMGNNGGQGLVTTHTMNATNTYSSAWIGSGGNVDAAGSVNSGNTTIGFARIYKSGDLAWFGNTNVSGSAIGQYNSGYTYLNAAAGQIVGISNNLVWPPEVTVGPSITVIRGALDIRQGTRSGGSDTYPNHVMRIWPYRAAEAIDTTQTDFGGMYNQQSMNTDNLFYLWNPQLNKHVRIGVEKVYAYDGIATKHNGIDINYFPNNTDTYIRGFRLFAHPSTGNDGWGNYSILMKANRTTPMDPTNTLVIRTQNGLGDLKVGNIEAESIRGPAMSGSEFSSVAYFDTSAGDQSRNISIDASVKFLAINSVCRIGLNGSSSRFATVTVRFNAGFTRNVTACSVYKTESISNGTYQVGDTKFIPVPAGATSAVIIADQGDAASFASAEAWTVR